MHAALPPLHAELFASWASWHISRPTPLTPPMTSTFETRTVEQHPQPQQPVRTTLPPIAHLKRHLPLTPPDEVTYSPQRGQVQTQQPPRLPPILDPPADAVCDEPQPLKPTPHDEEPQYVDWLDFTRTRSAHFLAEKTCEMICYLWFATAPPEQAFASPNNSPPFSQQHRRNSATTTLQLVATPTFVQFMHKLLETTQVSQSVIVLSLHYIYRLKDRNRFTPAQPGSEFRIAVAGLMMANKFLDDNTYTNKTWSEVSGIDLPEINKMEREFLMGVDFNLYVDNPTYESWLNLLKGLVMAKERDSRHFRKSRGLVRASRLTLPHASAGPATRTYTTNASSSSNGHRMSSRHYHRARSTSPTQTRSTIYAYPTPHHPPSPKPYLPAPAPTSYSSLAFSACYSPTPQSQPRPRPGSKRTAEAAFSPTTASFPQPPSKRPISLHIPIPSEFGPASGGGSGPSSHSPLEGLQSFARMSIDSPARGQGSESQMNGQQSAGPPTLVMPCSLDEERRNSVPQNLYFYTLSCSPAEHTDETRDKTRKAKLRYHQPPQHIHDRTAAAYRPPPLARPTFPIVVQSARTSPHEAHLAVAFPNGSHTPAATLPLPLPPHHTASYPPAHPSDRVHAQVPPSSSLASAAQYSSCSCSPSAHQYRVEAQAHHRLHPRQHLPAVQAQHCTSSVSASSSPIPSAPFANAGPPGVHFYPTPVQNAMPYPAEWARSRRY